MCPENTVKLFKPGDVLRYSPANNEWHCRQGTAIVLESGRAVDTYWGERGGSEAHVLTDGELASAVLLFNVGDYEEIGTVGHCAPSDEPKWLEYHPDDRRRIGSQKEHCARLYVRKGARPDLSTKISNARGRVEQAESDLRIAQSRLDYAREDLAKLEAQSRLTEEATG